MKVAIIGAGGFGREVADVIEALSGAGDDISVAGFVDDRPSDENLERLRRRGLSYLGSLEDFIGAARGDAYVIGVGAPSVREQIATKLDAAGVTAATVVHPAASSGAHVTVGSGSVICAGVRLTTNIVVGQHVHLNLNVTVGHDSTLDDFVSVNPLASISGDCRIGRGALIGVGGVVLQGLQIGQYATVGGSACVVKDVPPHITVKGVPAR